MYSGRESKKVYTYRIQCLQYANKVKENSAQEKWGALNACAMLFERESGAWVVYKRAGRPSLV